jgi:TetR/AcrR family acrAB operon transcriptional repressor
MMESWLFAPDSFDLAGDAPTLVNAFIDMLRLSPTLTAHH